MLILSPQNACFVAIPKTGSMSMARFLETALRPGEAPQYDVESLHDWHASMREVEATGRVPFSLYDMWSFAVVRNPFDRLVSYCAFADASFAVDAPECIRANVQEALNGDSDIRWMLPQGYFTSEVRTLYRFEDLTSAAADIRQRLGIPATHAFPTLNESERGPRYAPYFDQKLKSMVEELYADDLKTFDYRF